MPGRPVATMPGATGKSCPFSAGWRRTRTEGMTFTAPTGRFSSTMPAPDNWHPTQRAFYEACTSAGFPPTEDHNNPDATGIGPGISNNHQGIRWSTALGYLDMARHRLNLTIRPNCHVKRILFEGNRATGLGGASRKSETFAVEGEEIVLSAGAVGSPHLMLLSGVGPGSHLAAMGIPVVLSPPLDSPASWSRSQLEGPPKV